MLDSGFRPQVTQIVALLGVQENNDVQLLFFSATVSDDVEALVRQLIGNHACHRIDVCNHDNAGTQSSRYSLSRTVTHSVRWSEEKAKKNELFKFLKDKGDESTLVFVASKLGATMLAEAIQKRCGVTAAAIHADKSQQERLHLLESFVTLNISVLVSTNVLSRGMDLLNVENVVVYDFPKKISDYVHLIGRTGRVHNVCGKALTLVNQNDCSLFRELVHMLRQVKASVPLKVYQYMHSENGNSKAKSIEIAVDESKRAFRIREELMASQISNWKKWDSGKMKRRRKGS